MTGRREKKGGSLKPYDNQVRDSVKKRCITQLRQLVHLRVHQGFTWFAAVRQHRLKFAHWQTTNPTVTPASSPWLISSDRKRNGLHVTFGLQQTKPAASTKTDRCITSAITLICVSNLKNMDQQPKWTRKPFSHQRESVKNFQRAPLQLLLGGKIRRNHTKGLKISKQKKNKRILRADQSCTEKTENNRQPQITAPEGQLFAWCGTAFRPQGSQVILIYSAMS